MKLNQLTLELLCLPPDVDITIDGKKLIGLAVDSDYRTANMKFIFEKEENETE
jgi:lipoate-protein ligase A